MYYNHNIRTSIQEWKNRLYESTWEQFGRQLKNCIDDIDSNKQVFGLLQETIVQHPYSEKDLEEIATSNTYRDAELPLDSQMQQTSFCYQMLKYYFKKLNTYDLHRDTMFSGGTFEDIKKNIIENYLTPIFNYLHDKLDKSNSTVYLLEKYKRRTEWFTFSILLDKYLSVKKNYEQIFEDDLRLFLFDQGIDYPFSTPKSTSGRADIIASIDTDNPIVIEIKVTDKSKKYGKQRIVDGFTQVVKYTNNYNKDVGYLVVFNLDNTEINFILQEKNNIFPPMITLNNKIYFFIVINLNRGISASKIGKTEIVTITEVELTK